MLHVISIRSVDSGVSRLTYYPKMPLLQIVSCILVAAGVADRERGPFYVRTTF
jgi:hypothetical protein